MDMTNVIQAKFSITYVSYGTDRATHLLWDCMLGWLIYPFSKL